MTLCVAAICEGRYAVLATDRLVSMPQPNLQFEADYPKAVPLGKNCMLGQSGSIQAFSRFLETTNQSLEGSGERSVGDLAERLREAYVKVRNKKIEEDILYSVGLDLRSFYQSNSSLRPELVVPLVRSMEKCDLRLWVIVVGVDPGGPHIYKISNPGRLLNFDGLGLASVGSGEAHAVQSMVESGFSPRESALGETLGMVFSAKKAGEKAQSVGGPTRMFVIGADAIVEVPSEIMAELGTQYERERRRVSRGRRRLSVHDLGFLGHGHGDVKKA